MAAFWKKEKEHDNIHLSHIYSFIHVFGWAYLQLINYCSTHLINLHANFVCAISETLNFCSSTITNISYPDVSEMRNWRIHWIHLIQLYDHCAWVAERERTLESFIIHKSWKKRNWNPILMTKQKPSLAQASAQIWLKLRSKIVQETLTA